MMRASELHNYLTGLCQFEFHCIAVHCRCDAVFLRTDHDLTHRRRSGDLYRLVIIIIKICEVCYLRLACRTLKTFVCLVLGIF